MINAINSNLILLLWAQAENIVPTLWLCTWLWWFFILPLFICLYHGLQDSHCRWHGVDLQRKLAESAETQPAWKWIRAVFEAIPILPVSRLLTFLHKHMKCDTYLSYSLISTFQNTPCPNHCVTCFLALHLSLPGNESTQKVTRGENSVLGMFF